MRRINLGQGPLSEFFKPIRGVRNRELDSIWMLDLAARVQPSQREGEIIESGNEAVNGFAEHDRAAVEKIAKLGDMHDKQDEFPGLVIELGRDFWSIAIRREGVNDVSLQAVSMIFCPIYLEPAIL